MSLTTLIRARITARQKSVLDQGTVDFPAELDYVKSLSSGVAADQADVMFSDRRTLAASASENIDLAGALTGALGGTVTFAKVKAIMIVASGANANNVRVTMPATNGFAGLFLAAGDGLDIRPGGVFMVAAPALAGLGSVTPSTADIITIANSSSGTPVTYDILIIGASA